MEKGFVQLPLDRYHEMIEKEQEAVKFKKSDEERKQRIKQLFAVEEMSHGNREVVLTIFIEQLLEEFFGNKMIDPKETQVIKVMLPVSQDVYDALRGKVKIC